MQGDDIPPGIEELIPHRGEMLLIDEILEVTAEGAIARSRVNETWPMVGEEAVSALILIELAAQTAGLCSGLERIQNKGRDSDKKGFLVGIKQASLHVETIPVGTEVIMEARNRFKFESFREIEGICRVGKDTVAEVTLQVMQVEE